jgi:hypothetical protein
MPYLKGNKLTALQAGMLGDRYDPDLIYFVCLDGSISKRHAPRNGPLDDHDLDVLLTALRHYEQSPWRDMLGPDNTTSEHVAAVMQYLEELKT